MYNIIKNLENYIIKENYLGYDPYDFLTSPIFKLSILKNKPVRFYSQQFFRRIPINLRPIFGIKKGLNPVTLGLCIESFAYLSKIYPNEKVNYIKLINNCLEKLLNLQSKGYSGACWGYDFDWEARYTTINAYIPTVVATGMITNSLFEAYKIIKDEKLIELCNSSTLFVLKDLNKYEDDKGVCCSYSPVDKQKVLNASIKGARLLAQVFAVTKDEKLKKEAKKIINYVVNVQREDGSWPYSIGDARSWSDNYHTAYVLDAIQTYIKCTNDTEYSKYFEKGLKYYIENFFVNKTIPKYYNNKIYPIDSTAIAQSIITLSKNRYFDIAENVINWAIENMYSHNGYFYYQKHRLFTHKTSYMRWSNAWMFNAISYYLFKKF